MAMVMTACLALAPSAFAASPSKLAVAVQGLPPGAAAKITVRGPHGYRRLVRGSTVLQGLRPGTYTAITSPVRIGSRRGLPLGGTAYPITGVTHVHVRGRARVGIDYGTVASAALHALARAPLAIRGSHLRPAAVLVPWSGHVRVGAILDTAPSATLPAGLFAVVTRIKHEGADAVLGLRPANVIEAFPELNVTTSTVLTPGATATGTSARAAGLSDLFEFPLDFFSSCPEFASSSLEANLGLPKLGLALTANWDKFLGIKDGIKLDVALSAKETAKLAATLPAPSKECEGNTSLFAFTGDLALPDGGEAPVPGSEEKPKVSLPILGDLPVYVEVRLVGSARTFANPTGRFGLKVTGSASFTAGFDLDASFSEGISFKPVFEAQGAMTSEQPGLGKVQLGPELRLGIGDPGTAGIYVDVNPALQLDEERPTECTVNLVATVGVGIDLLELLDRQHQFGNLEANLFACPTQIAENTEAPTITGTPRLGDTLTANNGEWSGAVPITYTYQWYRGTPGSCDLEAGSPLSGATTTSYTPTSADVGDELCAVVTASNAYGATSVTTHATSPVVSTPPTNTTPPTVSYTGELDPGTTLTASPGTWASTTEVLYSYEWLSCDSHGEHCAEIGGVGGHEYTLTGVDVGHTVRVAVIVTNEAGSSTTESSATGVVQSAISGPWSAPMLVDPAFFLTSAVSCPSASFCAAVAASGTQTGEGEVAIYDGSSWSTPTIIDGELSSVSCASASFCVAVERDDQALTYDGSSWSAPTSIDSEGELSSVSCASASFCATVDTKGNVFTYNGSSWSAPTSVDSEGELSSVSCASASFCATVDTKEGNVVTYNGSSWSTAPGMPASIDGENSRITSLSCGSPHLCVVVRNNEVFNGEALVFNGGSWSAPTLIDHGSELSAVSCASSSFCATVDGSGNALTFDGSQWSARTAVGGGGLGSISCLSASFCAAIDYNGRVLTDNGGHWVTHASFASEGWLTSLSCVSPSFCAAVGAEWKEASEPQLGHYESVALTFNGSKWSASAPIGSTGDPGLNSVSCVSEAFCMAVGWELDEHGIAQAVALTYNGSSWSAPAVVVAGESYSNSSLASVSCSSEWFCAAVGSGGMALTFDGSSWSMPASIEDHGELLTSVSCLSESFCAAVGGDEGIASIFNGTSWSAPTRVATGETLTSVSCSSVSFCAAVDSVNVFTYNGNSWSTPTGLDDAGELGSVSCTPLSFCVAATGAGDVRTYSGGT